MSTTPTPAAIALPAHMQQEMEASTRVITALKVVDAGTYETAVDLGKELASGAKRIKEFFQPMKRAADEAKAAILAQEQKSLAPLEQAKAYLSGQVTAYRVEQDRIATAKRQEEEERERARIAENRRLEAAAATAARQAQAGRDHHRGTDRHAQGGHPERHPAGLRHPAHQGVGLHHRGPHADTARIPDPGPQENRGVCPRAKGSRGHPGRGIQRGGQDPLLT
jgi:hypothetical protein